MEVEKQKPEEETTFVPIGQRRRPTSEKGPAEDTNLASFFDEKQQKNIAQTVFKDYAADVQSRAPRMKRLKEFQGLYASVMKTKTFPFQNSANVNIPVLTYPLLQVQGRLYDMLLPANGKVVYSSPTGSEDAYQANVTELFANWYIRNRMPDMSQGMDNTLHQVCCYGSAFRRTYWNSYEQRVCSDWIPIEDFVVPYARKSQDPSMRDVPRYTLVQHPTYFDLLAYGEEGVYENIDKIRPSDEAPKQDTSFRSQIDKIEGADPSGETTQEDKERIVLEQYRKWRMPRNKKHAAFDGKVHAVIITIDAASEQLLRMVIREEPDPWDMKRWQKQSADAEMYTSQITSFVQEATELKALAEAGDPMAAVAPPPSPPVPPPGLPMDKDGLPDVKKQRMREICFFTHYSAFPSEGFYGLGFGDFLAGLNKATNTVLNQYIDGNTTRIAPPTFISRQMKGQRGTIDVQPGTLIEIDAPMGAMKDGLFRLDPPPPDPTSMKIIELLMGAADKLVASSDLMSGNTSGANRTAKETQILAEQMMMQITVLARRIKEAFAHELAKIWRCWGVFLEDEEVANVVGDDGPQQIKVGKWMFQPDADVTPTADPRTKTQRIEEAMQIAGLVAQPSPMQQYLLQNPNAPMLLRQISEDVFRAMGADKLIKLFPPPPQPPPPPKAAPYWEEDAGTLEGKSSPVHPMDNDDEHIVGHMQFLQTPAGSALTKEQKEAKEQHIRGHHAQKIRKAAQPPPQMGPPMGYMGPQAMSPMAGAPQ